MGEDSRKWHAHKQCFRSYVDICCWEMEHCYFVPSANFVLCWKAGLAHKLSTSLASQRSVSLAHNIKGGKGWHGSFSWHSDAFKHPSVFLCRTWLQWGESCRFEAVIEMVQCCKLRSTPWEGVPAATVLYSRSPSASWQQLLTPGNTDECPQIRAFPSSFFSCGVSFFPLKKTKAI